MRFTNKLLVSLSFAAALAISSGAVSSKNETTSNVSKNLSFLESYSNIALDNYTDALKDAKNLKISIDKFVSNPTQENLDSAKKAWLQARESYGSTEIFRLSNGPIDAEDGWIAETYGALEGQINAWPLDENMIILLMQMEKEHLEILSILLESLTQVVKNQKKLMLQKLQLKL